jgi:radical SAM superfamily enzyme
VNVLDPLFNANPDHAIEVLDALIAGGFTGSLTFQCRFLAMKARTIELLDRFAALDVELELGIQTTDVVVGDAVRRRSELDIAEATIAELHRRSIHFSVSLIYGLPHQTLRSFKHSVRWCQEHGIPIIRCYPLSLLVGTELWHQRQQLGLIEGRDAAMADVPIVVETPWMTADDMLAARAIGGALGRD